MAWLPAERVLFTGDILFNGAHPIAWAGPVSNWIAACDRIEALAPAAIVPGHGPLASLADVRELRAYFDYLYEQARRCHARRARRAAGRAATVDSTAGRTGASASAWSSTSPTSTRELSGEEPPNPLEAFQQMAELRAGLDAAEG